MLAYVILGAFLARSETINFMYTVCRSVTDLCTKRRVHYEVPKRFVVPTVAQTFHKVVHSIESDSDSETTEQVKKDYEDFKKSSFFCHTYVKAKSDAD